MIRSELHLGGEGATVSTAYLRNGTIFRYRRNAADLSTRFRDRPMSPQDTAVYWTEYVIRHKGAPHLKTAAVHMPWHEYLLLDVIAFLFLVIVGTLFAVYSFAKFILRVVLKLVSGDRTCTKCEKKVKRK